MTTMCDMKGCNRKDSNNDRMYKLVIDGDIPSKKEEGEMVILHFCYEHRNEIVKIIKNLKEKK
jgi:hypothetical protein